MNERIKEIWEKATVSTWPRPGKFTAGEYDYHLEKFAELIWQEAIDTVKETPTHCAFTTHQIGVVQCTIDKSVEVLEKKFKNEKGVL